MDKVMFSTGRDEWETPHDLFAALDYEFHFVLDACATPKTAKCKLFYTPEDNGLIMPWDVGGAVWCNPPYSRRTKDRPGQEDWIAKAAEEGSKSGATVVMLLPARTDTFAFHRYIYHKAEIRFLRGRLRFLLNGKPVDAAPFPSMVVIFRG